MQNPARITLRALLWGTVLAAVFAALTVYFEHQFNLVVTATQIAVLPYLAIFAVVLLLNPIVRLLRFIRPFTTAEVMLIFIMTSVAAGIPTFGLASQLVPVMSSLYNRHWNNDQRDWDRHVAPFITGAYFLGGDGLQPAAAAYAQAARALDEARVSNAPPERLAELDAALAERRAALQALKTDAGQQVETFRRGLPRGLRAFPGVFKSPHESLAVYRARLWRLYHGQQALRAVAAAQALAAGAAPDSAAIQAELTTAVTKLATIAASEPVLQATLVELNSSWDATNALAVTTDRDLRALQDEHRLADPDRREQLETQIARRQRELRNLTFDKRDLTREQDAVKVELEIVGKAVAVRDELTRLASAAATTPAAELAPALARAADQFPLFDATVRRFFLGDIPWRIWLQPMLAWGLVILLCYVMLMTFNVLIFRQWAHHERLIYPLAELPMLLAGADAADPNAGLVPRLFRSPLFWVGFGISAGVLGWNLLGSSGLVPGLPQIKLVVYWQSYLQHSILAGLAPDPRFAIFFTMIGLAFLIPAEISFSLWFFWLLYMVQLLIMVWSGHGVNERSFSSDWYYSFNFRSAEACGALIVFATVVLWKCRHYLLCAFRPRTLATLETVEQRELRWASALFLASSLVLVLVLWLGMGANLWYTLLVYFIVLVLTIGLVRAVTEGGLLGFQAWVSPFHLLRSMVGMDKAWTAPSLFAPLMVFYSIIFLDIKTFIAPAMANTLKIRADLRLERLRFYGAIALGIAVTTVVALATHLMLAYAQGADNMNTWFYTSFPSGLFDTIAKISKVREVDPSANAWWVAGGAGAMGLLLLGRQFFFWLPHPLGLAMLVNPLMHAYWTSIFLGWLAKRMVTRYGNQQTYGTVRCFFIGLIAGELVLVALSMFFSFLLERNLGITLNRN
jgi:hypothetical protein